MRFSKRVLLAFCATNMVLSLIAIVSLITNGWQLR